MHTCMHACIELVSTPFQSIKHYSRWAVDLIFAEYFAFESSSLEVAKARGISEETYYAIQKWMADNDKAKPVR